MGPHKADLRQQERFSHARNGGRGPARWGPGAPGQHYGSLLRSCSHQPVWLPELRLIAGQRHRRHGTLTQPAAVTPATFCLNSALFKLTSAETGVSRESPRPPARRPGEARFRKRWFSLSCVSFPPRRPDSRDRGQLTLQTSEPPPNTSAGREVAPGPRPSVDPLCS